MGCTVLCIIVPRGAQSPLACILFNPCTTLFARMPLPGKNPFEHMPSFQVFCCPGFLGWRRGILVWILRLFHLTAAFLLLCASLVSCLSMSQNCWLYVPFFFRSSNFETVGEVLHTYASSSDD